jgi:hypothetical protein
MGRTMAPGTRLVVQRRAVAAPHLVCGRQLRQRAVEQRGGVDVARAAVTSDDDVARRDAAEDEVEHWREASREVGVNGPRQRHRATCWIVPLGRKLGVQPRCGVVVTDCAQAQTRDVSGKEGRRQRTDSNVSLSSSPQWQ